MKLGNVSSYISAKDLLEVDRSPKSRAYIHPFGPEGEGTLVIGRAAPWKGVKGEQLQKSFPKVYENAKQLASASKSLAGIKGNAIVQVGRENVYMPRKAAKQMEVAGKVSEEDISPVPAKPKPVMNITQYVQAAERAAAVPAGA